MLKLSIIEFFLRTLPESFMVILAAYAFCKKSIDIKAFCISTILFSILTYLVRMLPIHFGVHTIVMIVIYVLLMNFINNLDIIKSASAGLISMIILFASEWINVFILTNVLKLDIDIIFKDPLKKLLYGIPSLVLFSAIIIVISYKNLHLGKVIRGNSKIIS